MHGTWSLVAVFLTLCALPPALFAEPPIEALLKLHTSDAQAYRIFRDDRRKERLEVSEKPVFTWTNPARDNAQTGHVFVWMHAGRPEAIGTMFSTRAAQEDQRMLVHEFHALSPSRLFPVTPQNSFTQWTPERGLVIAPLDGAPPVSPSASGRLAQIRAQARTFAAETRTREGKTWELRLLPAPMLRYEPTSGEVLDGALFAMVSSEGTDPELLLLIEARHPAAGDAKWTWHGAAVRFSDRDVIVKRNDKSWWSSLDDESHRVQINDGHTVIQTPDKTYMCYRSRFVQELPDPAP